MTRRASLPGADELFRRTSETKDQKQVADQVESTSRPGPNATSLQAVTGERAPRHDEKVTFYCTAADLTRLERARLGLRADFRLVADRGKIVRAALEEILDDFESRGPNSALVRRLQQD